MRCCISSGYRSRTRDIKSDALAMSVGSCAVMPEGLFRLQIATKLMRDGAKEIGFGGKPSMFHNVLFDE